MEKGHGKLYKIDRLIVANMPIAKNSIQINLLQIKSHVELDDNYVIEMKKNEKSLTFSCRNFYISSCKWDGIIGFGVHNHLK